MANNEYTNELQKAMHMLSLHPRAIFLGQTVSHPGSRYTYGTLKDVPVEKRIEMPIMENTQMGISTGFAIGGYIPVSIYPRFDFLLLAADGLVNHLDKMEELSSGAFKPKVIIRSIVGATKPIHPGPQHCQDHYEAFKRMLTNVDVVKLNRAEDIVPAYHRALHESTRSTLLIEDGELHLG